MTAGTRRLLSLLLAAAPLAALAAAGASGGSHRPHMHGLPGSFLSHASGAGRGGSGIIISGRGGAATVATAGGPPPPTPPAPMAGMPLATGAADYSRHYPAHAATPLAALKHFDVSEEKGLTAEEATLRCVVISAWRDPIVVHTPLI